MISQILYLPAILKCGMAFIHENEHIKPRERPWKIGVAFQYGGHVGTIIVISSHSEGLLRKLILRSSIKMRKKFCGIKVFVTLSLLKALTRPFVGRRREEEEEQQRRDWVLASTGRRAGRTGGRSISRKCPTWNKRHSKLGDSDF